MTEDEYKELYSSLVPAVIRYAARRVGSQYAGDVAADAFEAIWRLRDHAPEEANERNAWAFGVAKNHTLREGQRRRRKRHDNRFAADYPHVEPLIDHTEHVATERDQGLWLYQQLTASEQEIIDIAAAGIASHEAAAHMLQISIGAYATRLSRLRARLRTLHNHTIDSTKESRS